MIRRTRLLGRGRAVRWRGGSWWVGVRCYTDAVLAPVSSERLRRRDRWPAGWVAVTILAIVLVAERPAHAYIDPGSGSIIYQVILAGLLGLGFTFRRAYASVIRVVRGIFGGRDVPSEKANPDRI